MEAKVAERENISRLRNELIRRQGDALMNGYILALENEKRRPADGWDLDIVLQVVTTDADKALWRYYRYTVSSAPYYPSPGGHLYYFLRDKDSGYILSIGEVGFPFLALKARDDYLGITELTRDRIRNLANLGTAVSLPTYAHLLLGKMTALASLSREVREAWNYEPYVAMTTTSLYGKSSQYNRLAPFRFVGVTSGGTSLNMMPDEWDKWKAIARKEGKLTKRSAKHEVLYALQRLGYDVPTELFTAGIPRAIYVALLAPDALEFFSGEKFAAWPHFEVFEFWYSHWRTRWFEGRRERVCTSPVEWEPMRPGLQGVLL